MAVMDFSRYLPTRDEMARLIASRACYTSTDLASAVALGVAIGAGVALFYAPKSGRELRSDMSGKVAQMRSNMGTRTSEGAYARP